MTYPIPDEHVSENQNVEGKAYVTLFRVTLRSGSRLLLKSNNDVTWQGDLYEGIGIQMTGVGSYADDRVSRPNLQVQNPKGIFKPLVRDGELNRATITRLKVLKRDIESDTNVFQAQSWQVSRISSMDNIYITLELRGLTDGQNFTVPARRYIPPEFPLVSLR
jgi:phage-related protein